MSEPPESPDREQRFRSALAQGAATEVIGLADELQRAGDYSRSRDWLEEACNSRSHFAIWLGNLPWTFEELQSEPRFKELMDRMDFPRLK